MTEFKRNKGESFESFLRRFNRSLIKSRKLVEVRKRQYHKKDKNRTQQKTSALIGIKIKTKNEYLKKVGKIKEDTRNKW